MKRLIPSPELLKMFKSRPDMLIFEGYCSLSDETVVWQDGDNFALVARVGDVHKCCFVTDCRAFVAEVLAPICGKVELCGVDPCVTEWLRDSYKYEYETHCYLYVWNGQALPYINNQNIHPLSPEFAQLVSDGTHYHAYTDEIKECLARHPSAAITVNGKPICWCLCHLEKSLGMLYTLPEYRHKGYALKVMTALCNEVIANGDIPYAYIVTDNTASINLAAKYNLVCVKCADYFRFEKN